LPTPSHVGPVSRVTILSQVRQVRADGLIQCGLANTNALSFKLPKQVQVTATGMRLSYTDSDTAEQRPSTEPCNDSSQEGPGRKGGSGEKIYTD